MGTKWVQEKAELSARVVIESPSRARIDWPAKLKLLRSYDLPKESRELSETRASQFLGSQVNAELLEGLRSLQRIVWHIDLATTTPGAPQARNKRNLSPTEIADRMVQYLKDQRADVPQREPSEDGLYLSELFDAVAALSGKARLREVMQQIAPGVPLHTIKQSLKRPDEVLRGLLQASAADITAFITFGSDHALVVHLTSLNPIGALLLSALDSMAKSRALWAMCEVCSHPYPKQRKDQRTCSQRCSNTLNQRGKRSRKAARTKTHAQGERHV